MGGLRMYAFTSCIVLICTLHANIFGAAEDQMPSRPKSSKASASSSKLNRAGKSCRALFRIPNETEWCSGCKRKKACFRLRKSRTQAQSEVQSQSKSTKKLKVSFKNVGGTKPIENKIASNDTDKHKNGCDKEADSTDRNKNQHNKWRKRSHKNNKKRDAEIEDESSSDSTTQCVLGEAIGKKNNSIEEVKNNRLNRNRKRKKYVSVSSSDEDTLVRNNKRFKETSNESATDKLQQGDKLVNLSRSCFDMTANVYKNKNCKTINDGNNNDNASEVNTKEEEMNTKIYSKKDEFSKNKSKQKFDKKDKFEENGLEKLLAINDGNNNDNASEVNTKEEEMNTKIYSKKDEFSKSKSKQKFDKKDKFEENGLEKGTNPNHGSISKAVFEAIRHLEIVKNLINCDKQVGNNQIKQENSEIWEISSSSSLELQEATADEIEENGEDHNDSNVVNISSLELQEATADEIEENGEDHNDSNVVNISSLELQEATADEIEENGEDHNDSNVVNISSSSDEERWGLEDLKREGIDVSVFFK